MKREIFAALLLLAMCTVLFLNINYMNKLSSEIIALTEAAAEASYSGSWEDAAKNAEAAIGIWEDNKLYTHTVLFHNEVDEVSRAMYELLSEIYSQNTGRVKGSAMLLIALMQSTYEKEAVTFENIF